MAWAGGGGPSAGWRRLAAMEGEGVPQSPPHRLVKQPGRRGKRCPARPAAGLTLCQPKCQSRRGWHIGLPFDRRRRPVTRSRQDRERARFPLHGLGRTPGVLVCKDGAVGVARRRRYDAAIGRGACAGLVRRPFRGRRRLRRDPGPRRALDAAAGEQIRGTFAHRNVAQLHDRSHHRRISLVRHCWFTPSTHGRIRRPSHRACSGSGIRRALPVTMLSRAVAGPITGAITGAITGRQARGRDLRSPRTWLPPGPAANERRRDPPATSVMVRHAAIPAANGSPFPRPGAGFGGMTTPPPLCSSSGCSAGCRGCEFGPLWSAAAPGSGLKTTWPTCT